MVKLWVSGIPVDDARREGGKPHPVRGPELRDALNQCLRQHLPNASGEVTEVDRKDGKAFAFASLSNERTAKDLVQLSKEKKVLVRGEKLSLSMNTYGTTHVDSTYASSPQAKRSQWHDDRGDRGGRGKGGKGDSGWTSRERGGRGWKGSK